MMRFLGQLVQLGTRVFNPKFAALALIPGLIVILINGFDGGDWLEAIRAGGVQALVSAGTAGVGAKIIERFGVNLTSWFGSYVFAGGVGFVLKLFVGLAAHFANNTLRVWASVLVTASLSMVTAAFTNFCLRNKALIRRKWFLILLRPFI